MVQPLAPANTDPPRPGSPSDDDVARPPSGGASPGADAWRPWGTYGLIAANLAMFAFELSKGTGLRGPSLDEMVAIGANYGPLTRHGQAWRLLTAMFLHDGPLHVGMNMLCLYQVGIVERILGRAEFLALYFAAGLVGGLASVAIHPDTVSLGASGAVFGMFGAFAAIMVVRRKQMDPKVWRRTMRSLAAFFGINLAFGLAQSSIDLSAHVGGLAVGFVFAFVLAATATPASRHTLRALVVATLGAGISLGGLYVLPG